jgi:hypothetical protein
MHDGVIRQRLHVALKPLYWHVGLIDDAPLA